MGFMDKAKDLLNQHDDKVDQALDKAGEAAKARFAGHDEQIDSLVDRAQETTGAGDTTQAGPAEVGPDHPAEATEPAPEVRGGPQPDVGATGPAPSQR